MTGRLGPWALLLFAGLLGACARKVSMAGADGGGGNPALPPEIEITKDRKDLLFSFMDNDGKLRDVSSIDKVPEDRRKQVLVRDLSKRPEEVKADQFVYVADLTAAEGGRYRYAVVSRYSFDKRLLDLEGAVEDLGDGGTVLRDVVVYGTSWCGACAQARSWLRERGIPFLDKDVEKDDKAQAELARKAKRAGISPSGVPVIDVRGNLMVGFDPVRIEQWLKGT
jgi:glutaredoxin